jgi:hypothetical protein
MATYDIYKNLLGYDPREQQLQQQKLWTGLYGAASSPYEKMGLALGQLGGSLFGGDTQEQGQLGAINKVLKSVASQYQPNTPEYFKAIADALPADMTNAKSYASQMAQELETKFNEIQQKQVEYITKNPQQATQLLQGLAARIESNPNDATALKQYTSIANAMQVGTQEDYNKALLQNLDVTGKQQGVTKGGLEIRKLQEELNSTSGMGAPGSVGKGGAYRDSMGNILSPAEMKPLRQEFAGNQKLLQLLNDVKLQDVKDAESYIDWTTKGTTSRGLASDKTLIAQTKVAASQLLQQISKLPPGSASDADMRAAMKDFPGYSSATALEQWVNRTKQTIQNNQDTLSSTYGWNSNITSTGDLSPSKNVSTSADDLVNKYLKPKKP